jgi:hypothetical protein
VGGSCSRLPSNPESLVPPTTVIPRACGVSSTPRLLGSITDGSEYWVARSSRAMTAESAARVPTPSLRAQAKQSMGPRQKRMDCFVALLLAMTWLKFQICLRDPAALIARGFARTVRASANRGRRECRVPMHPQPRVRCVKWHTSVVTTGPPELTRLGRTKTKIFLQRGLDTISDNQK